LADVLAVGPHPDDVELAAGGTLARLAAEGHEVVILDLTRGERATRGTPAGRKAEAESAARLLGASRENLSLPDGGVAAHDPAALGALVHAIRRHRPRLVITLSGEDDHPDHREGAELVARAVYLAGVRNYPDPGGESHRVGRLLLGMGRRPFLPRLVVDVAAYYEAKRAALAAHASQFRRDPGDPHRTPISDPGYLAAIEARDRYYGRLVGAEYGEPFDETGPVAVRPGASLVPGDHA
jgi:bacillithiol biosynthesis deacetylase BshB1